MRGARVGRNANACPIVCNWSSPLERMLQSTMREGASKHITIQTEAPATVKAVCNFS